MRRTPSPACRYFDLRSKAIAHWPEAGVNPYPHKFHVGMRIPEFVAAYAETTETGAVREDVTVSVAGRVMSSRAASSKLHFYDLHGEGAKCQIMFNAGAASGMSAAEFEWMRDNLKRGDIVGA
jgi:lysyl-tRNA synthetase class 2